MKAGKKYSSNGVQYAMYPNQVMNISQSINSAPTHQGTNAIDDSQEDLGISLGYAPCDVKCVATDYINGNFIMWESVNPVQTAKHGKQYIHFYVGHDNTANAYVGMTISQGTQLFAEGTAGEADGNHTHLEVALGKYPGVFYVLNSQGRYMLPGNVNPSTVFFIDDTTIFNDGGLAWSKIDAPVAPPLDTDLSYRAHFTSGVWGTLQQSPNPSGDASNAGNRINALDIRTNYPNLQIRANIQGKGWTPYFKLNMGSTIIGDPNSPNFIETVQLKGFKAQTFVEGVGWPSSFQPEVGSYGYVKSIRSIKFKK